MSTQIAGFFFSCELGFNRNTLSRFKLLVVLILAFCFCLPCESYSEWPTEQYSNIQLGGSGGYEEPLMVIKDGEDGFYILIETAYSRPNSYLNYLYLQGIDQEGNVRWPSHPDGDGPMYVDSTYNHRYNHKMVTDGIGNVWVAWSDYRDADEGEWGYYNNEIRMQRMDANGPAWGESGIIVQDQRSHHDVEFFLIRLLRIQSNGNVMIIWVIDHEFGWPGGIYAQEYDMGGNPVWEENQELELWGSPNVEDGDGGWFIDSQDEIMHMNSNWVLSWNHGEIELPDSLIYIDRLCDCWAQGTALIAGSNEERTQIHITGISTLGNLPWDDGYSLQGFERVSNIQKVGTDSYGFIIVSDQNAYNYVHLNSDLEPTLPGESILLDALIHPGYFTLRQWGIYNKPYSYDTDFHVFKWDTLGAFNWSAIMDTVASEDWMLLNDNLGNIFVVWAKEYSDEEVTIVANILSPEGDLGLPVNTAPNLDTRMNLPGKISLSCWPNPFNNEVQIRMETSYLDLVNISIFNLLGQEVFNLAEDKVGPGEHCFTWKPDGLSSGIYFISLKNKVLSEEIIKKVVYLR